MSETAGELTFKFGADFSGFSRATDSAGHQLDVLAKATGRLQSAAASPLRQAMPLGLMPTLATGARAIAPSATDSDDTASDKELSRLADQLALLKTTGAAHDAIALKMKTEVEQAKLGADATGGQKQAVAALVGQIDAAKTAQSSLKREQSATNEAWSYGADQAERAIEGVLLYGGRLQDVGRSLLTSVSRQGLQGALTGSGSLAGLFGTVGTGGQTGGLFGAIQSLFGSGVGNASGSGLSGFSGLYANGGSIGAGQWGIAGEKGAEVVAGPATIVPWTKIPTARTANGPAASHQTINFNVSTPDAPSFARSETQMASLLSRAVGRGQRNA
ncbi:hypothetical protein [Lichenihabitans psoromatis]|uniref:hypothetical protein n=1 Tax=Lichenihabitans psoromatis TaxID=2528642 RepID=UPI001035DA4A|nr:hypothetical protein [Lichenihabitans psoromatis]